MDFDEIENVIMKKLDDIVEKGFKEFNTETEWTHEIKLTLGALGDKSGYKVCAGGDNDFNMEWLYDLVWYSEIDDQEFDSAKLYLLEKMPLVVESEWNESISEIKYDFEKLLVSNAEHRLMICQSKPNNINILLDYFKKAINTYENSKITDRYLIAILDYEKKKSFKYVILYKEI